MTFRLFPSPSRFHLVWTSLLVVVLLWPAGSAQAADPSIFVDDPRRPEGHSGTSDLVFTLTLSASHSLPVMVDYATSDGSASAPEDYQATSGTVTFPVGETQRTVAVPVVGDTDFEANEYFYLLLSNPVNATIGDGMAFGWVDNDDVRAFVGDVVAEEGHSGTTDFIFTISLSGTYDLPISIDYATSDGTATAPDDYVSTSGTVTFDPGESVEFVTVPVVGETDYEATELFHLDLSNPVNVSLGASSAFGWILNDDVAASFAGGVALEEGNSGTTDFVFTVSLSGPHALPIEIDYQTLNGTAAAPGDFQAVAGTKVFSPGETEQFITVPVVGDTDFEADEDFTVVLSNPVNADLDIDTAIGSILNDDVFISIADAQRDEGDSGTPLMEFSISLSGPYVLPVSVDFTTSDGTARAPQDYASTSGTVTFPPGVIEQQIGIPVFGDEAKEPDEDFLVTLSNPINSTIVDGIAVGTILNDDATPGLFIQDLALPEGDGGTTDFAFPVTLSFPGDVEVQVDFATVEITAQTPEDFQDTSGTLIFPAGETLAAIHVPVVGEGDVEPDEVFDVFLSAPVSAVLCDHIGRGTIINDDFPNEISIDDVSGFEGDAGTTDFVFTVTLDAASAGTVEVDWATANGDAVADVDYVSSAGTVTFLPGETARPLIVAVIGDTVDECEESFLVELSDPVNGTIIDGQGVGTIQSDDALTCSNADGDCFHDAFCGGSDCDDTDPSTYPCAPEVHDGLDNQCPGDFPGFGVVDEISGLAGYFNPADLSEFSWPGQTGATLYEVVRSTAPHFTAGCLSLGTTPVPWLSDPDTPAPGGIYFYLVRSSGPFTGSWGQDWTGAERSFLCPGP